MALTIDPLTPTGRKFDSTVGLHALCEEIVNQFRQTLHEFKKRHVEPPRIPRVEQLLASVIAIMNRHKQGQIFHYEIEENWMEELGDWTIKEYARITKTGGDREIGKWFPERSILRKSTTIYTG